MAAMPRCRLPVLFLFDVLFVLFTNQGFLMNASVSTPVSISAPSTSSATFPVAAVQASTTSVLAQLGAALFLGLVMLYAVGFSESAVAHNAAHDVRHANGRPCH